MTVEQELAKIIKPFMTTPFGVPADDYVNRAVKAILSSGLVVPVSALDGMVEEVAKAQYHKINGKDTWENIRPDVKKRCLILAQATINAIKKGVGKA